MIAARALSSALLASLLLLAVTPVESRRAAAVVVADAAPSGRSAAAWPLPQVRSVKVTYSGGDAVAGPQVLTGKDDSTGFFLTAIHSVNIDFLNLVSDACNGDRFLAEALHRKNPISAIHVLELNIVDPPSSGGNHIRWGNIAIEGKTYDVLFSNFQEKRSVRDMMVKTAADSQKTSKTYSPKDWDGYVLSGGRFYVIQTSPRQVRLNCPGVVDLEITIVRRP
ncbi:MAG TPA: hypothetical protein VIK50_03695 [Gemmatimonadaceae bacterium]